MDLGLYQADRDVVVMVDGPGGMVLEGIHMRTGIGECLVDIRDLKAI